MSLAIIEINDCGLCCGTDKGDMFISPGYALLTEQGVTTGNAARLKAYLKPQQSFNQFWRQLNLSPLPSPTNHARHNADLAYAQLLELHRESGSPEEVVFATPGSFDRDQLSIILGLAKASPFKTLGLIDSAVAATSQLSTANGNQLLHLDIQLHQLVLTRLTVDSHIERTLVEVIADTGLKTFYDSWARYIADKFIQQYRYDPLHTAEGEQQLYNLLPDWLGRMNGDQELAIALDSPQGSYRLNINRNDLLANSSKKLDQLKRRLNSILHEEDTLVASHRINLLPGLTEQLGPFRTLPDNAAVLGCLENIESIAGAGESIHFVTRLPHRQHATSLEAAPQQATLQQPPMSGATIPTHVLYQHRAQAIGDILYIHQSGEQLSFSQQQTSTTTLIHEDGEIRLRTEQEDVATQNPSGPLHTGDIIKVGTHSLQLIEVA
tara:strand:+ start:21888 stop:23198 length:1311 start_codon:yes stop_codon:yes gene_type:complete